jgi:putative membrane protein
MLYLWIKAFHIISVIAWMAATLYMPRLFVYHSQVDPSSEQAKTFALMELRLQRYIANPAMIATWVFGLWLVFGYVGFNHGWLHAKLLLVLIMSGFHGVCSRWRKDLASGRNMRSPRFFRIANEVPTVLLILIVILVVVQPF